MDVCAPSYVVSSAVDSNPELFIEINLLSFNHSKLPPTRIVLRYGYEIHICMCLGIASSHNIKVVISDNLPPIRDRTQRIVVIKIRKEEVVCQVGVYVRVD